MYFSLNRCHPCRSTTETKTFHLPHFGLYSRTSGKRPPKMRRLTLTGGGRLSQTTGEPLPRRGLGKSILWKIIYGMQFLGYATCSFMLLLKIFTHVVYFKEPRAYSEHRDQRLRQVVAYKRWESFGVLDWRSIMGGGRLREVIAHGGSTVYEIGLFHPYYLEQSLRAISSLENCKSRRVT